MRFKPGDRVVVKRNLDRLMSGKVKRTSQDDDDKEIDCFTLKTDEDTYYFDDSLFLWEGRVVTIKGVLFSDKAYLIKEEEVLENMHYWFDSFFSRLATEKDLIPFEDRIKAFCNTRCFYKDCSDCPLNLGED